MKPHWHILQEHMRVELARLASNARVRFICIGGANTVFSTMLYACLILLFGPQVPAVVSLGVSWLISLVLVFVAYRRLVFHVSGHFVRDLARFASVNAMALVLNSIALMLATDYAGFPPIISQVVITCLIVTFNYFGHRYFSFRR